MSAVRGVDQHGEADASSCQQAGRVSAGDDAENTTRSLLEMTTILPRPASPARRLTVVAMAFLLAMLAALSLAAPSRAALTTVGSPLAGPANLNTTDNLGYAGTNTNVISPEFPTGVAHTAHFGADTAIWNTSVAGAPAGMPEAGQADKVRIEGCAQQAPGGPAPLTQFHVQVLHPQANGTVKVSLTSQPFELPVCGQGGASASTVSTYEPINLCVAKGDFVGFNDEGGFVERFYRAGVPYQVLGSAGGSSLNSFIKGGGTNDGAVLTPRFATNMEGWATASGEELMLQVELGTGPDARYVCPGGTKDAAPVLAPVHVRPQTDGVNSSRMVSVSFYCRPASGCSGKATLTLPSGRVVGRASFNVPGNATSHVPIRISPALMRMIRRDRRVPVQANVVALGQTFTAPIVVGIL